MCVPPSVSYFFTVSCRYINAGPADLFVTILHAF